MIQPINALSPRVGFRGSQKAYRANNRGLNDSQIALANAGGIAFAAGGLTTLVARSYTNSFVNAGVLGLFGAFLTMFFMTPHLIEKLGLNKLAKKQITETVTPVETQRAISTSKPIRKLVQFRSEKKSIS